MAKSDPTRITTTGSRSRVRQAARTLPSWGLNLIVPSSFLPRSHRSGNSSMTMTLGFSREALDAAARSAASQSLKTTADPASAADGSEDAANFSRNLSSSRVSV